MFSSILIVIVLVGACLTTLASAHFDEANAQTSFAAMLYCDEKFWREVHYLLQAQIVFRKDNCKSALLQKLWPVSLGLADYNFVPWLLNISKHMQSAFHYLL